MEIPYRF